MILVLTLTNLYISSFFMMLKLEHCGGFQRVIVGQEPVKDKLQE